MEPTRYSFNIINQANFEYPWFFGHGWWQWTNNVYILRTEIRKHSTPAFILSTNTISRSLDESAIWHLKLAQKT
jgi:hypothetical protein